MKNAELRVTRGAMWLDDKMPGWELKVNLQDLEMSDCASCVLGQLFGHFTNADVKDPELLGFEVNDVWPDALGYVSYDDLRVAWTTLIKQRLDIGIVV